MSAHEKSGDVALTSAGAAPETRHIVDQLIEERAEKLIASPFWPAYRAILYPLLKYPDAVKMADAVRPLDRHDIFSYMMDLLAMDVQVSGQSHIPTSGRVIIAPTHPTGIADGIAMYEALAPRRKDMTFFANRDALRAVPGLGDMIIPVEWVEEKRTRARSRETLVATKKSFEADKCVVLFPSGRLAFMGDNKKLTEQPWLTSLVTFAKKYDAPIVPVKMTARNSRLYYWFWKVNAELRDITLFNELLNKRGKTYGIEFGAAIAPGDLEGDPAEITAALRVHASSGVPMGAVWAGSDR